VKGGGLCGVNAAQEPAAVGEPIHPLAPLSALEELLPLPRRSVVGKRLLVNYFELPEQVPCLRGSRPMLSQTAVEVVGYPHVALASRTPEHVDSNHDVRRENRKKTTGAPEAHKNRTLPAFGGPLTSIHEVFPSRQAKMVEAAGIEPASRAPSAEASTHVVSLFGLASSAAADSLRTGQPALGRSTAFPARPADGGLGR